MQPFVKFFDHLVKKFSGFLYRRKGAISVFPISQGSAEALVVDEGKYSII